jgi:hypothetical protein
MASVSSLRSQPVRTLVPDAMAAQTIARFVRLLEPGTRMDTSGGVMG